MSSNNQSNNSNNMDQEEQMPETEIISGWEHSVYAHQNPDRYAYMGKNEDGEPEWIDWGPATNKK